MKKIIITLTVVAILLFTAITGNCITYSDIIDQAVNEKKQAQYNTELNAPFSKETSGVYEEVNPETGGLNIKIDLFSFKLNEEFSNNFSLAYNLSSAKNENESVALNNDKTAYINKNSKLTKVQKALSRFGTGFSPDIPYVEVTGSENKSVIYMHIPEKGTYIADFDETCGLKEYLLEDLTFSKNDNEYTLAYTNGIKYTFNSNGLPVSVNDRFNNTVYYMWRESSDEIYLDKIYDTCGNIITISYEDKLIHIIAYDRMYTLERTKTDEAYLLTKIILPDGQTTEIEYETKKLKYTLLEGTEGAEISNYCISKIKYSGNITVGYSYTVSNKNANEGYMQYLKVKRRYDSSSDGKTVNDYRYEYNNEPDGYPSYKEDNLPVNYEYFTSVYGNDGTRKDYKYSFEHNLVSTQNYVNETAVSAQYNNYDKISRAPTFLINRKYNDKGEYIETFTETAYDKRGNLLSKTTFQTLQEKEPRKETYTYGVYELPLSYEYNYDNKRTVKNIFILSADGKSVKKSVLTVNDAVLKTDFYEYDSRGNLTYTKQERNKGKYAETEYKYQNCYPVSVTYKNIEDADGTKENITIKYEYDSFGNIIKEIHPDSGEINYVFDKKNRLVKEITEDGSFRSYIYDDKNNTIITNDAEGGSFLYEYDEFGRLFQVTYNVTKEKVLKREYDEKGLILSETDFNNTVTKYTYDRLNRLTDVTVYDEKGEIMSHKNVEYNEAYNMGNEKGIMLNITQGDRKTQYIFDYRENLLSQTMFGKDDFRTINYTYDLSDNNISISSPMGKVQEFQYDIFGNVILSVTDGIENTFKYDYFGNLISETNGENETVYYTYDALNRNTKIKTPYTAKDTFSENKMYYDFRGNQIKTLDGEGNITEFIYNKRGFLTESISHISGSEKMYTLYEYDNEGRQTKVSYGNDSNNLMSHTYEYNHLGQNTKLTDNMGNSTLYEYDFNGNLLLTVDRNKNKIYNLYDSLGRLVKTSADNAEDIVYTYNMYSQPETVTFGNEKTVFTYSPYGELVNRAVNNVNHSYGYDADSNLISYTMSKDNVQEVNMSYEYDSLNRLKAVISPLGRVRYTYDKANRLIDEESSNGLQTSYDLYPSGNIRRITYQNNGNITDKLYYEYDKAGNRLVEQNDEYIREYTYDGINRLISSDKDREYYTYYEYDGFNNLKTVYELTNGETYKTVYEYDKNNRLVFKSDDYTTSFYEYDNKGNLIKTRETDYDSETESLYFYDGYNRLSEILKDDNIISYTYDYEGIRNSKTVNGIKTAFITDNGNVIAEYTEEKSNRYFRGNSLIGLINQSNEGFYYNKNAHGDIISLLDYKGDPLNNYSYTDWGAIEETKNQNFFGGQFKNLWQQETKIEYETPFTHSGEYLDLETGLIYLRNRYYDPNTQRFITEDPAQDGLNWYAYCGNNPINFVDPWGLVYVPLRDTANMFGGEISWNSNSKTATVTIGETVVDYHQGDGKGTFIQQSDNKMYIWDETFYSDFTNCGNNRIAAVAYALSHDGENEINSDYRYFGEYGDCTNFVSQCLLAGGFQENDSWYYRWGYSYSNTWTCASDLYNYAKNNMSNGTVFVRRANPDNLNFSIANRGVRPGDILGFQDEIHDGAIYHLVIITSIDEYGNVYYSGHSRFRENYELKNSIANGNQNLYFLRINY